MRINTAKIMEKRRSVAPKLCPILAEPSLSSPTFSTVESFSFYGNPKVSLIMSAKSKSSMNSPSATRFSSYSKNWIMLG